MRYALVVLTCVANSLFVCSLSLAEDHPVVTTFQVAQLPPQQANPPSVKPAPGPVPGMVPLQQAPTQIQVSNELKTLQGVERLEQRMTLVETMLKQLVAKIDALSEITRVAHEQQRLLGETIQAQTQQRYEFPPAQRWELVFGGQAVVDKQTGLIWQRQVGTTSMLWSQAAGICAPLGVPNALNPHRGWRLPTVHELSSLAPLTQQSPFVNVHWDGKWYWTSTVNTASRPYHAADGEDYPSVYAVGFSPTGSGVGSRATQPGLGSDSGGSVWCVRGG